MNVQNAAPNIVEVENDIWVWVLSQKVIYQGKISIFA